MPKRKDPAPAKPPRPESAEKKAQREAREAACASYDRMVATRPLKPPPGRPAVRRATASELALAADKRAGLLGGPHFVLDTYE